MQTEEIWKDIPEYNGRYQASTLGRIRSVDRTILKSNKSSEFYKGKVLKPFVSTGGYLYVTIAEKENNFCPKRVHRLIAKTFIPNPHNLPQINHINENKADNRAENLEWCTASYNMRYGSRREKFVVSNKNNSILCREVNQYDLEGNYLRSFPSAAEAARFLDGNNVTACRIGQCCRHIFKVGNSAYGYLWEFSSNHAKGKPINKHKKKGFPINQYTLEGKFIKRWDTTTEAAQTLKLDGSNICRAITYNKTCGGFRWSKASI